MNRRLKVLFFVLIFPVTLYLFLHGNSTAQRAGDKPSLAVNTSDRPETLIRHWQTSNGATVYFVPTETLPILDIEVDFAAGSSRDGSKPGLSALCAQLLDKGALEWDANQIADKFEDAAVQYHAEIDKDRATFSLRTLTTSSELKNIVDLFAHIIASPNFKEENIKVEKEQMLVAIKRNLQQPSVIAAQNFYKTIYQNHPYATPSLGTEESVGMITRADLLQFHQHYFVGNNATITLVGGISEDQAKEISQAIASKLATGNKAATLPEAPSLVKAVDLNIPFRSEQTHVLMGQPCEVVGDVDFFPLLVGNYSLGGNVLGSRLFKEVRETRGLAYNVRSTFMALQKPGPFVIQLQTQNSQAKSAIEVMRKTLHQFIEEGPTDEEVNAAKQGIVSAFPLSLTSNGKIMDVVSLMAFYHLPLDFLQTYQTQVEAVSREDIKKAFSRRLNENQMALIAVGAFAD